MVDWSQIVEQHGRVVWRIAWRLLGNEADAADCFQRTFLTAVETSAHEPVRNWPGFLQRLATARALEQLRERYRSASRLSSLPSVEVADRHSAGPLEEAEARELTEHLREALATLDDRLASVFTLTCLEGLTYEQTAKQLGITANHVGVLLHQARSALRPRLQAHAPAPRLDH